MLADVVFDAPVFHPFSYRVPIDVVVAPGQRVLAPLRGAQRVGMVIALHEREDLALKPLLRVVEPAPILSGDGLQLARWIATESLSSLGSTCAALLPPPFTDIAGSRAETPAHRSQREVIPELLIGAGRERRVLERVAEAGGGLLITADIEAAGRWALRLAKLGPVARLDSGVADRVRAAAWRALATGDARLAVGTRSALLAPLPAGGVLVLLDEHEAAHKPPGPPRMHSREVALERAVRERIPTLLTSATPSVETWWRAEDGQLRLGAAAPATWPAVTIADTRGILRREPLTPALSRALREALAAGHRVFLGVSRLTSALACDECGDIVRCETCAIALAYSRAARTLTCRLCGAARALMDTCPGCRGRRLSPFGWGVERVEHAVKRRFPGARVARHDPEAARGARADAQRAAAAADVVIGTRGALRLFGPASLGLVGFVSPDQLLRLPDFRASERALALMWAAAERLKAGAPLIVQSQTPDHYALDALARQDLGTFYKHEMRFRAELGYPPFRRLAVVTVHGRAAVETARVTDDVVAALRTAPALTVYPPAADRSQRRRRIVIKGRSDLPALLATALQDFLAPRTRGRGIMEVEVDPVEWQF